MGREGAEKQDAGRPHGWAKPGNYRRPHLVCCTWRICANACGQEVFLRPFYLAFRLTVVLLVTALYRERTPQAGAVHSSPFTCQEGGHLAPGPPTARQPGTNGSHRGLSKV